MMNVQKYPAYKDSGVEWLGEIPEHWSTKKLKFLGKIYAGLNGKKGDDFSKEYSPGIKPYIPFTNICNNIRISDEQFHFVKVDEKEPVPVPSDVLVVKEIVGLVIVAQTTPLAVIVAPPSSVILPPVVSELVVTALMLDVVSVGTAFNLFARQNLRQVSRFLNL